MSDASPNPNQKSSGTAARVFGVILMIIGFLLLSAAGLCTLIFGGMLLTNPSAEDIGIVLLYGGGPMIVGALIAWGGHTLWRSGGAPK